MFTINILGILSVFIVAFADFYYRYLVYSSRPNTKDLSKVYWFLDSLKAKIITIVADILFSAMLIVFVVTTYKNGEYFLLFSSLVSWFWYRYLTIGIRKYRGYIWDLEVTTHILTRNIAADSAETIISHQNNFLNLFWKNSYRYIIILVPFVLSLINF